jgi:thiamine biosynthesis lipoprotein
MPTVTPRFQAMASVCELHLVGDHEAQLQRAAEAAIAEVQRIERVWSRYRPDSVVSHINAAAGTGERVVVDAETAHLLNFAAQLHTASGGLFDITSGVLRRAWDFKTGRLPEPETLAALLPLIGWPMVSWDGQSVALPQAGMELDFGGFGKEYAADRAHALLVAHGVRHGWVNLGGDLRVIGPQTDGRPWVFGIQHPRAADRGADTTLGHISLSEGALATSGDYERYFECFGRRYCHILDPRTGWPVQHWRSVSVVAPVCVAAGALSTIAMLMGDSAIDFLSGQNVRFLACNSSGAVVHEGL